MDHPWYKRRGYIHFDQRVPLDCAEQFVTSPQNIKQHSFYPFISYEKVDLRYRRDEGKVVEKKRPIGYAAHRDSHIYSYYSQVLSEKLESFYSKGPIGRSVLAYRSLGKNNTHFAAEAFCLVEKSVPCVTIAIDVSKFFDTINHDLLKKNWCTLLEADRLPEDHFAVFRAITKYAIVDLDLLCKEFGINRKKPDKRLRRVCTAEEFRRIVRGKGLVKPNKEIYGIPQGSPISATLSNVYMLSFDQRMINLAERLQFDYRRYSDDILLISPPEQAEEAEMLTYEEIKNSLLTVNPDKTEKSRFCINNRGVLQGVPPVQYLGFTFDGQRRLIRSKSLAKYHCSLKHAVQAIRRVIQRKKLAQKAFRRNLYERFTHLGKRNFISYGYKASKIMHAPEIRRQLAQHWNKLQRMLNE